MHIAIVLYEQIEPIELAVIGTLSMAKRINPELQYVTISEHGGMVVLNNGLRVDTDYSFADAPAADVLIVTGGPGWQAQANNPNMLDFLVRRHASGECLASVCTGAMLLASAGLLAGKRATTKVPVAGKEPCPLDVMAENYDDIQTIAALVVDEGNIITGGGVTLGIDLTLYLLSRFLGSAVAEETARIMEYEAAWTANRARLPILGAVWAG
ncbi:AraC family transcriptional regulator [Pusillimonas sp. T7-7]|uniref:DJ-1/PfpI family protein n=1 Tax=Pusillimonas sp. (strain T7-7) TaxID=1007105 RepID=UPI000208438C|nr:DJ-1/PfpI family protein [Pusillimonas sp. T7-7]AEC21493.1 AraC family transcriptional regulator [Pusillimonas sp. T7-7]